MAQNHVRKQILKEIESEQNGKNQKWEINSAAKVTF